MNTDVTVKRLKINDVSIVGTLKMQNKIPTMLDFLLWRRFTRWIKGMKNWRQHKELHPRLKEDMQGYQKCKWNLILWQNGLFPNDLHQTGKLITFLTNNLIWEQNLTQQLVVHWYFNPLCPKEWLASNIFLATSSQNQTLTHNSQGLIVDSHLLLLYIPLYILYLTRIWSQI